MPVNQSARSVLPFSKCFYDSLSLALGTRTIFDETAPTPFLFSSIDNNKLQNTRENPCVVGDTPEHDERSP